jgi:hypothetical protein
MLECCCFYRMQNRCEYITVERHMLRLANISCAHQKTSENSKLVGYLWLLLMHALPHPVAGP